jgi:uncharacterized protein (TIGR03067 family)
LNLTTTPKQLDVLPSGADPFLFIYELTDDTLKLAFTMAVNGPARPKDFRSGSDTVVLLMERAKSP